MEDEELEDVASASDLLAGTEDYEEPGSGLGGLSGLGIPGAEGALAMLVKSQEQARAALQTAREKVAARKYNKAIPLLAISGALGQPTRSGSSAEGWANAANALMGPLRERDQFAEARDKELLGIDTQLAGLDQNTAMTQLQLAQLRAKLNADAAKTAPVLVRGPDKADGTPTWIWSTRPGSIGQEGYTQPGAQQTINLKGETKAEEVVGAGIGEDFLNIQRAGAIEAPRLMDKVDRLEYLMKDTGGGAAAPLLATVASIASSFNIKLDPKLGPKQAAEALSREMALVLRNPSEGAGMPGNLSNQDREYLKSMVPGLAQTPEGRALIIQTMRKLAARTSELAKIARKFKRENKGRLDEGLYETLQDYADKNPLFTEEDAAAVAISPAAAAAPPSVAPPPPAGMPPPSDDEAPAVAAAAPAAPAGARRVPASWAVDPANPPLRVPAREKYLREHPETAQAFLDAYKYLPPDFQ